MIHYNIIWCAMTCYDITWHTIIWYGIMWSTMMNYDMLWYAMICYDMIWCTHHIIFYNGSKLNWLSCELNKKKCVYDISGKLN